MVHLKKSTYETLDFYEINEHFVGFTYSTIFPNTNHITNYKLVTKPSTNGLRLFQL